MWENTTDGADFNMVLLKSKSQESRDGSDSSTQKEQKFQDYIVCIHYHHEHNTLTNPIIARQTNLCEKTRPGTNWPSRSRRAKVLRREQGPGEDERSRNKVGPGGYRKTTRGETEMVMTEERNGER